jgi:uncharacterized membrane protein HdeD (DUF308 family)
MTTSRQSHRIRALPSSVRQPRVPLLRMVDADIRARESIRRRWVSFVAFGVALIVLGFIALGVLGFATSPSAFLVGGFLVLTGLIKTTEAPGLRSWGGFAHLRLAGLLALVVGLVMLANPAASERSLTLVMATFFTIVGIVRLAVVRSSRFPGRVHAMTSDAVTVLLGVVMALGWPASGAWTVGTFVAINLIFDGWSLVMAAVIAYEHSRRAIGPLATRALRARDRALTKRRQERR